MDIWSIGVIMGDLFKYVVSCSQNAEEIINGEKRKRTL